MPSSSATLALRCAIRPIAKGCKLCLQRSVQARAFEKSATLTRFYAHLQGLAVAIDRQRDFHAGLALRPDAAEETGEVAYVLAGNRNHDITGAQIRLLRRPAIGQADNDQAILDFGCVEAEPRPRRRVAAAEFHEVVDDRFQQIDRHHHVDVLSLTPLAGVLELQRADAEKITGGTDQGGAAPIRM